MKKVLVTGSNGLLGQKLTDYTLKNKKIELIATGKGSNRHPESEGFVYQEMDVLSKESIRQVVEKYHPDAIIHTAAMTNVDACELDRAGAFELNVTAVANLIAICEIFDIQLIHLSTDFIFDGEAGPYLESDAPNPLSYYGETKLWAEQLLEKSTCRWAALRTMIVYGVVSDMSRSNIVLWAKSALEKGNAITVVNDQWRMPTLAEDLATLCVQAILKDAQGVYNASGNEMFSIIEMVEAVADFWKLDKSLITPISANSLKQSAPRPVKTGFILDKTIRDLDYQPTPFVEGLTLVNQQLGN